MTNQINESIKQVITHTVGGKQYKVIILESPEDITSVHGVTDYEVKEYNVDTRIFSYLFNVYNPSALEDIIGTTADYLIMVYDYKQFSQDINIMNAIIGHELGHITNPVQGDQDINAEVACDLYAVEYAGAQAVYDMLNTIYKEAQRLGLTSVATHLKERHDIIFGG